MIPSPFESAPVFFTLFVSFWIGFSIFMAYTSGWRSLARHFRGRPAHPVAKVWMGSARMGAAYFPTGFGSCLNVTASREGVGLSLFPIFALATRPLLIPWDAMGECRTWTLFGVLTRFQFQVGWVQVTLHGRAARMMREQFVRLNPGAALLASAPYER
jgi:hypothetical protein